MAIVRKGKVLGKMYDVITPEEYSQEPDIYNNNFTAIQKDNILYPISKTSAKPGFFVKNQIVSFFIDPPEEEREQYSADTVIDFTQVSNIKEMIDKSTSLEDIERKILCTPDNIYVPYMDSKDAPEVRGLKEAIEAKHIDLDKYEDRFDGNYNNDRRLLNKNNISLGKYRKISDALDIKVTLILEDKHPNVPNPMGKTITVELTSGGDDSSDE